MDFSYLSNLKLRETKDVYAKVKVNNVTEGEEPFMVGRVVDGEVWYWGRYPTKEEAGRVAEEIGGIVLEEDKE